MLNFLVSSSESMSVIGRLVNIISECIRPQPLKHRLLDYRLLAHEVHICHGY